MIATFAKARRNRRARWFVTSGLAASLTLAAIVMLNFREGYEAEYSKKDRVSELREESGRKFSIEGKSRSAILAQARAPAVTVAESVSIKDSLTFSDQEGRQDPVGGSLIETSGDRSSDK